MNSSLKKLIKYLVYGVIISLLICVIPNKQPNKGENLMVVMVAIGSLALLDKDSLPNELGLNGVTPLMKAFPEDLYNLSTFSIYL